jgi:serine/threonine protein kinase
MIGQTLDHYRIESKLGEGGMGVVYEARDTHLDRPVAIKILPADKVADPGRKQRFVQEARAASALNHPNIVTIYDIRSQDGTDFIVMEHIKGRTLDQLIAAKGMHPARALKYAVQIADAMAQAHGAGILHRDLKPSNIMVTDEGRAKLLDFGLAKLLEPMDSLADAITLGARPMTKEGAVLGTAAYMSPEQAEGRPVDARSDIFSFGAVLYEILAGCGRSVAPRISVSSRRSCAISRRPCAPHGPTRRRTSTRSSSARWRRIRLPVIPTWRRCAPRSPRHTRDSPGRPRAPGEGRRC